MWPNKYINVYYRAPTELKWNVSSTNNIGIPPIVMIFYGTIKLNDF